ncbi:MAG: hypothetical protein P8075_13340 [Deltaproteobacteria bacterium]|jgi:hypothetical protein
MRKGLLVFTLLLGACLLIAAGKGNPHRVFSEKSVRGSYGFSFQGEILGVGPVAAVGVLEADGRGNITDASRTINISGITFEQTFTCTYSVNPDGTGSAVCELDEPPPEGAPAVETFGVVLVDNAKGFRFVGTTPGIVVLGTGTKQ